MRAVVQFDGASRGNPGPSATGYVVKTGDTEVRDSQYLGDDVTNNEAEYQALIHALESARELGCDEVAVRGDSEVVVKQVDGRYDVNSDNLRPLYRRVKELEAEFDSFVIEHLDRSKNEVADGLADAELDRVTGSTD